MDLKFAQQSHNYITKTASTPKIKPLALSVSSKVTAASRLGQMEPQQGQKRGQHLCQPFRHKL